MKHTVSLSHAAPKFADTNYVCLAKDIIDDFLYENFGFDSPLFEDKCA